MKRIGIISDTHGTINPKIFKVFKDVDMIIHAGDVVGEDVMTDLATIAQVVAVFGNMDTSFWSKELKEELDIEVEGKKINVSHKTEIPLKKGYDIVIRGHTHRPEINTFGRTLFINPGSANPGQSIPKEKPSVAILEIDNGRTDAKLVFL